MSDKMRTHTDGRNTILQQDLTIKENPPGSVLVSIYLWKNSVVCLQRTRCSLPWKESMKMLIASLIVKVWQALLSKNMYLDLRMPMYLRSS